METLVLTLNGDYKSYIRWVQATDTKDIFREAGINIVCWFNFEQTETMDKYQSEIMCFIKTTLDLEELKTSLDESIRDNIKKNNSQDFTLVSVKIK